VSRQPKLTNYVSEVDQFFHQFDKKHPQLSTSQRKEREKYLRIYRLRDTTDRPPEAPKLWEGF
jgi:hypothetical protein